MRGTSLLRNNRNYRNLWLAKIGSQFGDWFNQVALAQVTLTLTRAPSAMGLVLLLRSLPGVVLGPLVSPLVDRLPKRPLLITSDLLRALFALSYSAVILFHAPWVLYVSSFLLGASGVLFAPARNAAIPFVVDHAHLSEANALESGMSGILQMVGAVAGGIVAITLSPVACFAINAASYVWSAMCITRSRWNEAASGAACIKRSRWNEAASGAACIKRSRWDSVSENEPTNVSKRRTSYLESLLDGMREARYNRIARAIILIGISWGLAGGGYYILIPVLGQQTFHAGGLGIGTLYAVDGLGVVIGAFLVKRIVKGNHRRAVVWYGVAYLTQALFFGLTTQFTVLAWGSVTLLLMRVSSGVIIPLDTYLLQTCTPTGLRGRVFALHGSTYGGVMQLSYALTGLAFDRFGVQPVGLGIGCISLLCGCSWLLQFGWRRVDKGTKKVLL